MTNEETIHFFSQEEVNVLIPRLEEHFQKFWAYRQNAQNVLQALRKNAKESQDFIPGEVAFQQIRQSQAHFLLEQAKQELETIMGMGCAIKDLEIGKVDFPHILEYEKEEEEEVYLCWKYGEKKVRYWHGLKEGFTGRKPLARKVHPH